MKANGEYSAACYDCGLAYGGPEWIEAIIPDEVWKRISPTGNLGGILCITCMIRRLKRMEFENVPIWLCGTEPVQAISGDPGDSIVILRNWDIEKEPE